MRFDTINEGAEQKEDRKKDERKRTQQSHLTTALVGLVCEHPNCNFKASNREGLVNHRNMTLRP